MHSARAERDAVAAASSPADVATAGLRPFLTFAVAGESYAASIEAVREIIEVPALTPVPLTPPFVRGVINLRGAVVPVLDLAQRFECGASTIGRRSCVVVIDLPRPAGGGSQLLGVLVDAVHEVVELAAADIAPAPALGTRIHPEFIGGIARTARGLQVVLDLGRVLAEQELAQLVAQHRSD